MKGRFCFFLIALVLSTAPYAQQTHQRLTKLHYSDIALAGGLAAVYIWGYHTPSLQNGNWENGLDLKIRSRAQSGLDAEQRQRAKENSNKLGYFFIVPTLLPPLLLPFDKPNRSKHLDMIIIATRAFATEKLFGLAVKNLAGRERPRQIGCRADINHSTLCNAKKDQFRSFYSAHTATAFNFAGLFLFQQQFLDPYGLSSWLETRLGRLGRSLVLYMPPLAVATGIAWLRVKAEEHWFSDVAVGTAAGLGTGYFMPKLLYTGRDNSKLGLSMQYGGAVLSYRF